MAKNNKVAEPKYFVGLNMPTDLWTKLKSCLQPGETLTLFINNLCSAEVQRREKEAEKKNKIEIVT